MCAKKPVAASGCEDVSEDKTSSPALGNTVRSRYRVLRAAMGRPIPRSVNRDCASRKTLSGLKVSSPDKPLISVVAMRVLRSEATPDGLASSGTTGVQVHGEFRRVLLKLGRSPEGRPMRVKFDGQGIKPKSKMIPPREVRWPHSSWEVG